MGAALYAVSRRAGWPLRLGVLAVVLGGLVLPILAGLWETGRAAFGILPAIGAETLSLDPWRRLLSLPGFWTSFGLTLWTGVAATGLSLVMAAGFAALIHGRLSSGRAARLIAPLLAAPHAALAIGLGFLIAPSGWLVRLVSPWATGWQMPPDIATLHDPRGLALILGLALKEMPFCVLVILVALGQLPVAANLRAARALGHGPGRAWLFVILPQVYRLIRLPVFVVLSFSLSVVDMAIVLGPSNPPVLAVAMTRWFFAADSGLILPAAAAALLLGAVVGAAIGLWALAETAVAALCQALIRAGGRGRAPGAALAVAGGAGLAVLAAGAAALAVLFLWSVTWRWSFPAALPEVWSLSAWMRAGMTWSGPLGTTLVIGLATTAGAVVLAIAWLEGEERAGMERARWAEALIYVPLIVPQAAFLYGLSVVFLRAGVGSGLAAVIWGQALFVFPYVMLALSDPWRALDRRLVRAAAALGAGPWRRLFAVKLPILAGPVLTAAAIGFAVSVAQYLPTLFLGAGRIATLTTEAVTLSSGADRRVTAVYAVLQAALPFAAYALALSAGARRRVAEGAA